MRFGSVCSGIEAASVAWHPLGWTTEQEIEEAKKRGMRVCKVTVVVPVEVKS